MIVKTPVVIIASLIAVVAGAREHTRKPKRAIEFAAPSESDAPLEFQIPVSVAVSSETLNLLSGKSMVVTSEETLTRISVTDPNIASATIVSPTQVLIHGHLPGSVTMVLWDEQEEMRFFDLNVGLDVTTLNETFAQVLGEEQVTATASGDSIVLVGSVSSKQVAERAVALAQTQAENVVDLTIEVSQQIMLHVRFAEVDRSAIMEYGFNLFSTGAANTTGYITTGQFGSGLVNAGAVPEDTQRGRDPDAPNLITGSKRVGLQDSPATFGLSDLLNVFLFRPDIDLGLAIRALEQENLLEILAEPNLIAQNGREASFLAGGEFPFPVVQGVSGGIAAVTIEFREFGIRLNFTPTITSDGTIALKVAHEVSALDFGNALTISGFVVPALSTRRAETEVQLRDQQSFAIAGLLDNRVTEVGSSVPWLGDIPILGKFFSSKSVKRNNQELLVLITPEIVRPLDVRTEPPGPDFPEPFLDRERFDNGGKSPENDAEFSDTESKEPASDTESEEPAGDAESEEPAEGPDTPTGGATLPLNSGVAWLERRTGPNLLDLGGDVHVAGGLLQELDQDVADLNSDISIAVDGDEALPDFAEPPGQVTGAKDDVELDAANIASSDDIEIDPDTSSAEIPFEIDVSKEVEESILVDNFSLDDGIEVSLDVVAPAADDLLTVVVTRAQKGGAVTYDFREGARATTTADMFTKDGEYGWAVHYTSGRAVPVPGTDARFYQAWQESGKVK